MKKITSTLILAIVSSGACLAEESIIGNWNCNMTSEYGDFTFNLTLDAGKTYKKETNMFGTINTDTGTWKTEGNTLVMNRTKSITGGKEKESSQEFQRTIVSNTSTNLELKHANVKTSCSKESDESSYKLTDPVKEMATAFLKTTDTGSNDVNKLDCKKAVFNAKDGIDTMLSVGEKNYKGGHLSETEYEKTKSELTKIEKRVTYENCSNAKGTDLSFYKCMSNDNNHVAHCGKKHNF